MSQQFIYNWQKIIRNNIILKKINFSPDDFDNVIDTGYKYKENAKKNFTWDGILMMYQYLNILNLLEKIDMNYLVRMILQFIR